MVTNSWRVFKFNIQSSLSWMKPEECFYVKENFLYFVFLTLHISVFKNAVSLAKDFIFKVGFPYCACNFESNNKLKSTVITIRFVGFASNSSNSSKKLLNTSICSFSVLASDKFTKMYWRRHQELKYNLPYLFFVF